MNMALSDSTHLKAKPIKSDIATQLSTVYGIDASLWSVTWDPVDLIKLSDMNKIAGGTTGPKKRQFWHNSKWHNRTQKKQFWHKSKWHNRKSNDSQSVNQSSNALYRRGSSYKKYKWSRSIQEAECRITEEKPNPDEIWLPPAERWC